MPSRGRGPSQSRPRHNAPTSPCARLSYSARAESWADRGGEMCRYCGSWALAGNVSRADNGELCEMSLADELVDGGHNDEFQRISSRR